MQQKTRMSSFVQNRNKHKKCYCLSWKEKSTNRQKLTSNKPLKAKSYLLINNSDTDTVEMCNENINLKKYQTSTQTHTLFGSICGLRTTCTQSLQCERRTVSSVLPRGTNYAGCLLGKQSFRPKMKTERRCPSKAKTNSHMVLLLSLGLLNSGTSQFLLQT